MIDTSIIDAVPPLSPVIQNDLNVSSRIQQEPYIKAKHDIISVARVPDGPITQNVPSNRRRDDTYPGTKPSI